VRDLLFGGPRRYGDLLSAQEGIPTNVLADRLKRLEAAGIVEGRAYSDRPPRREYALTARGRALGPVLQAMAEWGLRHVPGTRSAAFAALAASPASPGGSSAPAPGPPRRPSRA
jgi:DNA-binding HxlR family transcriptional regulator